MDPTTIDLAIKLISSVGFPIAVAAWLLVRTDALLREVRDAVRDLTIALKGLKGS